MLTRDGATGELVEIDPIDGTRTTLRANVEQVEEAHVSDDGRWVLWWPASDYEPASSPSSSYPRLWDRQTDAEIEIGAGLDLFWVYLGPGGVAAIGVDPEQTEITFLDGLGRVTLDDFYTVRAVGNEGTLLLQAGNLPGYGDLFTLPAGDSTATLRGRQGVADRYVWSDEQGFWSVQQNDGSAPGLHDHLDPELVVDVVRFPYDSFAPGVVAPDLLDPVSLAGEHWVGARDYGEDAIGELWLHTGDGTELHVDDDVFAWLNFLNRVPPSAWPRTQPAMLVDRWIYLVFDDAGERRGLWLAAIEPA